MKAGSMWPDIEQILDECVHFHDVNKIHPFIQQMILVSLLCASTIGDTPVSKTNQKYCPVVWEYSCQ
jgi:hypothetical protein